MQKRVQSFFISDLKENNDGTISGGFAAIATSVKQMESFNNNLCQNGFCNGTVNGSCTNTISCAGSTNFGFCR
ncbi:hypothetical protein [Chitinophaga solisilvae]|uniref:Uncharacterized protein n=1 Tax=Chitinophaga solisilvae TaxID=1233460 RepID=A0A3S1AUJ7_9BACT|nr:hypothetical protein [Chitinophaga solisilvae]NSL91022.1 hypothetical protein [Chitinophaga solisilvae]